ncbi:MAG TPA: hypothetical protein DEP23_09445 [Ruminococcaceae bacterium]|nr:hypothetical protein [Oscillospiraceae bacterium]
MSENKAIQKKPFATKLTNANDTFMPLIMEQMQVNNIEMSQYSRQCVLHAISAIHATLDKAGISWASNQLDKSNIVDILMKVACFQLNASASPRELYFQTRNVKHKGADGRDEWMKQIEMGIEGDGNDALLSRFGRDVVEIGQIWKVREDDDFTYPTYNGLDMDPPKWTPKGQGKIVRIVYPIIKSGKDGKRYVEFYIAERSDVINNLLAHISSNMMQETFGFAKDKYSAKPDEKEKVAARRKELLMKARDLGLDGALDDPELQPWISPSWTEFHSRDAMIERKMRNNAIKKIPKDFANGAMETLFEEVTDDVYRSTAREIAEHANTEPIDITVDEETGEVIDGIVDDEPEDTTADMPNESDPPEDLPAPGDEAPPPIRNTKAAGSRSAGYTPGF